MKTGTRDSLLITVKGHVFYYGRGYLYIDSFFSYLNLTLRFQIIRISIRGKSVKWVCDRSDCWRCPILGTRPTACVTTPNG